MVFQLPSEYEPIQEASRALAVRIEPVAADIDDSSDLDPRLRAMLAESGLCELTIPREYGGRFEEVDPVAVCVAREAFMPVSAHLDALFALQGIGSFAISLAGSADQRETWLPRLARADALAALALTEPEVGSDLRNVTTTVEERGGELHLRGRKSFISNAGVADFYSVFAREGDDFSLVLVPADTLGVHATPGPALVAPHVIGSLDFDGVVLPETARIGQRGDGMRLMLATLATFRVSVGAAAVGLAQAALDEAARHATTRSAFGRPLAKIGAVSAMLADTWTEVEMTRLFVYRVAELAREAPNDNIHFSSMAKVAATEAAGRAVDRAVQTMGRFGLVHGSRVERLQREARPLRIVEGTSEILRLGIAKGLISQMALPKEPEQ